MLKNLIARIRAFLGRSLCSQGFHKWSAIDGQPNSRYCSREGCLAAQVRSSMGLWENLTRQEVTLEQVQKLNRHERRRLGSLARRGAFGRIPE